MNSVMDSDKGFETDSVASDPIYETEFTRRNSLEMELLNIWCSSTAMKILPIIHGNYLQIYNAANCYMISKGICNGVNSISPEKGVETQQISVPYFVENLKSIRTPKTKLILGIGTSGSELL